MAAQGVPSTRLIARANVALLVATLAGAVFTGTGMTVVRIRGDAGGATIVALLAALAGIPLVAILWRAGFTQPIVRLHALVPPLAAWAGVMATSLGVRARIMPAALWDGLVMLALLAGGAWWMNRQRAVAGVTWRQVARVLPLTLMVAFSLLVAFVVFVHLGEHRNAIPHVVLNIMASGVAGCAVGLVPLSPWMYRLAERHVVTPHEERGASGGVGGTPAAGGRT